MYEFSTKLEQLDFWPYSALDRKREVLVFSPALMSDLEELVEMFDTFEPKAAVQGLPPLNRPTRIQWIKNMLCTGINIKVQTQGRIIGIGSLFPMPGQLAAEIGLFVHNKYQFRGAGRLLITVLMVVAKRLGMEKVWVSEERNNSRAIGLYYQLKFKHFQREMSETYFELDLSTVSSELDFSMQPAPVITPSAEIEVPDYLSDQDLYDDTHSVLIFSPEFEKFQLGQVHPFVTDRSRLVLDMLKRYKLLNLPGVQVLAPKPLDEGSILSFHDPQYLYYLQMTSQGAFIPQMLDYGLGTGDNPIAKGVLEYANLAAGASVMGADLLASHPNVNLVFSPTGGFHHAGVDFAAGFCYINDVVLAIKYLLQNHKRILYVDIDAHHGDGVQFAFYDDPGVLKISLHESGRTLFPWNSGFENEIGDGDGYGYNVNIPLAPGTVDDIYLKAFNRIVPPLAEKFAADVCVSCVGVDTMFSDPLSHLSLSNNAYADVIQEIRGLAPRLLLLGSGGYNPDNISRDWALAWAVLHNAEPEGGEYFGQAGAMMSASEVNGVSLRDQLPFVSPMKIAEAEAEAERVISEIETHVFPIHGLKAR